MRKTPTETRGAWKYTALGSVLLSYDFYLGVPLGLAAASSIFVDEKIISSLPSLLVGVAGVGAAVATLVLTSLTVLLSTITPAYRAVLDRLPGGTRATTTPFFWVVGLSVSATVLAVLGAGWIGVITPGAQLTWVAFILTALPFSALLWAVLGCAQLAQQLVMHWEAKAAIERKQEQRAAEARRASASIGPTAQTGHPRERRGG